MTVNGIAVLIPLKKCGGNHNLLMYVWCTFLQTNRTTAPFEIYLYVNVTCTSLVKQELYMKYSYAATLFV